MKRLIAASMLLLATTAAHATPFTYDGYSFNGSNVHVTYPVSPPNTTIYAGAGAITLHGSGLDIGTNLTVMCFDIMHVLQNSGTFSDTIADPSGPLTGTSFVTGDTKIADITALLVNGMPDAGSDALKLAGLQEAIWASIFKPDVVFTPDNPAVTTYMDEDLDHLLNHSWIAPSNWDLHTLIPTGGASNQILGYAVDFPLPVSEPSAWAVFILGLTTLALARRRLSLTKP